MKQNKQPNGERRKRSRLKSHSMKIQTAKQSSAVYERARERKASRSWILFVCMWEWSCANYGGSSSLTPSTGVRFHFRFYEQRVLVSSEAWSPHTHTDTDKHNERLDSIAITPINRSIYTHATLSYKLWENKLFCTKEIEEEKESNLNRIRASYTQCCRWFVVVVVFFRFSIFVVLLLFKAHRV